MRHRITPVLAALLLLLAACGDGDDDDAAADETTTTTQESDSTSSTTGSTVPATNEATDGEIARVVVQIDDHLRRSMADGDACLRGPHDACAGFALESYEDIEVSARQTVEVLPRLLTEGSDLYQGRPSAALQARVDNTVNLGAAARTAFEHAHETCVPDFPPECDDANAALRDALDDLLKDFNSWRDDYDPATDPANEGESGGAVVE